MRNILKDLNLNSAFLFAAALEDPETCKLVLEILLGHKVPKVNVKSEHTLLFNPETKCIRLDIHATTEFNVNYNLEAQNENEHNIPLRCRYYQSEMDMTSLKPGEDYSDLKESYVIFICAFDPFGDNLCKYTFERVCRENSKVLGDGSQIIIFNTKGKNLGDISIELAHFFTYLENSTDEYVSTITDESIIKLHEKVNELKKSRELEDGYMKFEELLNSRERKISKKYLIQVLEIKGTIPESLMSRIEKEYKNEVLEKWFTLALNSKTIDEFINKIQF